MFYRNTIMFWIFLKKIASLYYLKKEISHDFFKRGFCVISTLMLRYANSISLDRNMLQSRLRWEFQFRLWMPVEIKANELKWTNQLRQMSFRCPVNAILTLFSIVTQTTYRYPYLQIIKINRLNFTPISLKHCRQKMIILKPESNVFFLIFKWKLTPAYL